MNSKPQVQHSYFKVYSILLFLWKFCSIFQENAEVFQAIYVYVCIHTDPYTAVLSQDVFYNQKIHELKKVFTEEKPMVIQGY